MKKLMIAAMAGMTALSPLAATGAFAQTRDRDVRDARREVREERRDVRQERRELNEARRDLREERREARFDSRRHNGYWMNGRFYRGQPTAAQMRRADFRWGYHQYRRGERLNAYDRARYVRVADYRRYHLSAPPRGYEWRRSNTGEYILAAVATGVILSVILGSN
ncbi:MAG: RcnB family protein [Hyphomonadaceae bacterium]